MWTAGDLYYVKQVCFDFSTPQLCDSHLSSWRDMCWYEEVLHTRVCYCNATWVKETKPGRTLWQPSPHSLRSADKGRKEWIQKEIAIRTWKMRKDGKSECKSSNTASLCPCDFCSFLFFLCTAGTPERPDIPENTHLSRLVLMVSEKKTETDRKNWLYNMKNELGEWKIK